MKKLVVCTLLFATVVLTATTSASAATVLYGTVGNRSSDVCTLVEIDPDTGALVRSIGAVGHKVNGLAWDPTSGKLYGSTSSYTNAFNGLIELDLVTGAGTAVGAPNWGSQDPYEQTITNITIDSAGRIFGWTENTDDLVSIDKTTGVATVLPQTTTGTAAYGLAFDEADTLWLVNYGWNAYTVDPSTGATTYFAGLMVDAELGHHGDFQPETGLYFGLGRRNAPQSLVRVDIQQDLYSIVPTIDGLHTLAFAGEAVPEPGTFALLGLGLAGIGMIVRRRRRA